MYVSHGTSLPLFQSKDIKNIQDTDYLSSDFLSFVILSYLFLLRTSVFLSKEKEKKRKNNLSSYLLVLDLSEDAPNAERMIVSVHAHAHRIYRR